MTTSGSQKRKTTAQIKVNCTPAQKAAIVAKANAAGLSPAAICLAVLLDAPLPRHHSPTINDKAMTRFMGQNARLTDALRDALAELGKSGSNLNQIAYMLNANTAPARIINIIESALADHSALVATWQAATADLDELRTMGLEACGFKL